MRTINHESDFKIIEGFKDGSSILAAPFRFTYYTKVPRGVYVAEYNGSEFLNCYPTDDGRVVVPFDSPKLGMGVLMVKREFFLNDKGFADGICNLVSVESTGITLDRGATDMDGEVNIELFPFYQQGDTGKSAYQEWLDLGNEGTTADFIASLRGAAFTYEDFTPEQLEALKGKDGKDGKDGIDGKDGSDASVVLSTRSALFHDDSESSNPIAIRLSSGLGEYAENVDAFLGNEGLYISSNRSLGILLSSDSGLEIGTNAVVDGKTLDSGRGLSVKVGTGLIKDGNGLSVKVSTDGSIESTLEGGIRVGTLSIGTDESKRPHILIGTGLETTGNRDIFIDSKKLIGTSSEAMYQVTEDAISPKQGNSYKLRTGVRLSTMRDLDDYIDANSIVLGSAIMLNNGDVPEIGVYYDGDSFGVDDYNRLKIANDGVKSRHIAPNSVGENHIQAGSINEYALQRYAVTSDALRNGSVTEDKLSEEVKEKLNQSSEFSGSASDVTYEGDLEANNVQEAVEELNTKKVDRDDNAPKLTAGFANNLVGRGEATEEEISFRPSGDTSIEDGTARIERVKGSTVVWNQLIESMDRKDDYEGITTYYDGVTNEFVIKNLSRESNYISGSTRARITPDITIKSGHVYYLYLDKYVDGLCISNSELTGFAIFPNTIYVSSRTFSNKIWVLRLTYLFPFSKVCPVGSEFRFKMVLYDLTQMFGAGNEPTTIEEFNARKPIGIDEYAYNEGELISTNVDEVKSVGFNAYNGTYAKVLGGKQYELVGTYSSIGFSEEIGGELTNIEISSDKLYTPEKDGYIYAQGSDICIHLTHTGYRNGEYEPYKEFRRSLPISEIKDSEGNQLFPNGLLSAGSVYDEITATKAIKKIGVVDMGTLNWRYYSDYGGIDCFECQGLLIKSNIQGKLGNILCAQYNNTPQNKVSEENLYSKSIMLNASTIFIRDSSYTNAGNFKAAMSGVMLYYELAELIEVDLEEPINMDYEVSDFGTEEVISSVPTTPLKADIIYQFNAVDRIRDNSRHTAEAEELLNAKADKTTVEEIQKKELQLSVKDNGNIVLSNANGDSKEFMPATPSGDPMHYAYIADGAEWNDTDTDIVKSITIPSWQNYGEWITEDVVHKSKCYRIGTCGDLTSSDMAVIYNDAKWWLFEKLIGISPVGRCLLTPKSYTDYYYKTYDLSQAFNNNKVMQDVWLRTITVANPNNMLVLKISDINFLGQGSLFKRIIGVIDFSNVSSSKKVNLANLEYVNIIKLKNTLNIRWSPNISKDSAKYMIVNATPTKAITITFHPDAYARLGEDADVLAALEAKNAELQGTGGSISLVSA